MTVNCKGRKDFECTTAVESRKAKSTQTWTELQIIVWFFKYLNQGHTEKKQQVSGRGPYFPSVRKADQSQALSVSVVRNSFCWGTLSERLLSLEHHTTSGTLLHVLEPAWEVWGGQREKRADGRLLLLEGMSNPWVCYLASFDQRPTSSRLQHTHTHTQSH